MKIRIIRIYLCIFLFLMLGILLYSNPTTQRIVPDYYVPGEPVKVELNIDPGKDALAWVVEETVPAGWNISRIDNEGVWDKINQKVKWGLFLDHKSRKFTYYLIPPSSENTLAVFSGMVSVNGHGFIIQGVNVLDWELKGLLKYFLGIPGGKPIDTNQDDCCDIGDIFFLINK